MRSTFFTEKCTGCRACELACSYHHRKTFSPSIASIHIERDDEEGDVWIKIYDEAEDGHLPCNCQEGDRYCLNYCAEKARDGLKAILSEKTKRKGGGSQ
jgi:Fe-S-cluster-containing hydrogenase component 2